MQPRRLLMIGTDRKIFEEGSAVRARQVEYAKQWDEVHIIVFKKANSKLQYSNKSQISNAKLETVIAPNCWAYSTDSRAKFMYPFDAISLGSFLIEKRGITEITCQDSSLTAMAGISLKKKFTIPLEIQVHEDIGSAYYVTSLMRKIRKTLALSYLPRADHIRVVSNKIKDYLVNTVQIDAEKIEVRPVAVDTTHIKNAPIIEGADLHKKYPQFEKIVLVAARLEKEKNVGLAIDAWKQVMNGMPKAGLIIVGSGGQESSLKNQVGAFGVTTNVIFEQWANQTTLFSYYKTCDAFLVTSLFEGYGMTLVEARAAGCKIVSTDVGVAREVGAQIVGWEASEVARGIIEALAS